VVALVVAEAFTYCRSLSEKIGIRPTYVAAFVALDQATFSRMRYHIGTHFTDA
jgi:hypothetical protein